MHHIGRNVRSATDGFNHLSTIIEPWADWELTPGPMFEEQMASLIAFIF